MLSRTHIKISCAPRRVARTYVQPDFFSTSRGPVPDVWRIEIEGVEYSFSLRKSPRAKNVILKVGDGGGLEVVVPRRMTLSGLDRIIREKSSWILRHADPSPAVTRPEELTDGTVLTYLGRRYVLRVRLDARPRPEVRLSHGEMQILVSGNAPEALREALTGWYRHAAASHIKERLTEMGKGLSYGTVRIKDMSTRWGSCSPKGNLSFSWRLVAAPEAVIDYLIVHELMHLIRPDHSKGFWRLVERRCPDYERHRKWLSDNGRGLGKPL